MKKLCQSQRTVRERELRKQRGENRRFNDPLKIFIERKYPEIFKEYTELYKRAEAENPNRRNLTTSKTFKGWLDAYPLKKPMTASLTEQTSSTIQMLTPQILLEPVDMSNKFQEDVPCTNIINMALQETFAERRQESVETPRPEVIPEVINIERVDEIINELMENQDIQDMLQQFDIDLGEDEGIELNHFDEIRMDIEPFDYNLEVDPFEF